MPTPFETGSLVEVRGERWRLTGATAHGACTVLTLEGRDRDNAQQQLRVIDPFDRSRPITSARPKRRPRRAVLRAALGAVVDARPATGLWTAASAAIDLWPYQLEPALAAINGATRLLIADAVGLGKTIQAGLLLSELRERGWIERALIVCPAGLRDTWARELVARFGIRAAILDQAAIAERLAVLPPGANPWAGHAVAIASIDLIKRAAVLAAIEREPIDLVIADEAHHLTPGTDRGAAVSRLASRATWCVLLSATPHSGDAAAFEYLTNVGARGDAMTIFRRGRADVGLATARRSHVLAVSPTADEAALCSALDQYTRAMWRERGRHDHAVKLIAITLSRRAASSSRAIARTLARRLELLGAAAAEPIQPLLPWEDDDDADGIEADAVLSTPGLESASAERACLERLIQLSGQCETSSKIRRLMRLLNRLPEPAVVFTEYRDSLEAVVAALQSMRKVAAIHGGMTIDLRRSAVDAFNEGRIDVLVATDAAGEGLNLHHRCRLVVDLELPWNPLRLEQRVGRVDRLGQRRTVHAIRLFHRDTIEQRVLEHLRLRDRRAAAALEQPVTDTTVANAIFEGHSIDAAPILIASSRVATAAVEAQRIEEQRRAHRSGAMQAHRLSWTAPRNGRRCNLVLLTRRSLANDSGAMVCDGIDARVLALAPMRNRRVCRQLIDNERDRLMRSPSQATLPADEVRHLAASRAAIGRRVLAIRANTRDRVAEQPSLFDRRAESAATARQEAIRKLDEALSRTLQVIAPPSPERTRVELIAAWPEIRR